MPADTPAEGTAASEDTVTEGHEGADESGPIRRVADTVTPPYVSRPDTEMTVLGWSLFLGIVLLLLPFLPLVLVAWGISKVLDALNGG